MMLDLNLILESLQKMVALKCLILSVEICSALWKVKRMKRTQHTSILQNQLCRLSHRIPSFKMSHHRKECIQTGWFELNLTALPTDKFQLTEEHDQAQRNQLEVHSLMWHSSYTKEFDVITYRVDYAEYMLCSLNLFKVTCKSLHSVSSIPTSSTNLQELNLNSNKIKTVHNNDTT